MGEDDLEVLVTLDDPEYGPEEDIFNHKVERFGEKPQTPTQVDAPSDAVEEETD